MKIVIHHHENTSELRIVDSGGTPLYSAMFAGQETARNFAHNIRAAEIVETPVPISRLAAEYIKAHDAGYHEACRSIAADVAARSPADIVVFTLDLRREVIKNYQEAVPLAPTQSHKGHIAASNILQQFAQILAELPKRHA
jgi:hypothetical protein